MKGGRSKRNLRWEIHRPIPLRIATVRSTRRCAARFRAAAGARYRFTHRCSSLTRLKAAACSLPASTLGEQRERKRRERGTPVASIGPYFPRKPPSQSPAPRRVIAGYRDSQKRGRDSPFEIPHHPPGGNFPLLYPPRRCFFFFYHAGRLTFVPRTKFFRSPIEV